MSSTSGSIDHKRYDWSWFRTRQEQSGAPARPAAEEPPQAELQSAGLHAPAAEPPNRARVVVNPAQPDIPRTPQAREDQAQIVELLEEMEAELDECRRLPFSRTVLLDRANLQDLIEEIRSTLPQTIVEAEQIKLHKHEILEEAKDRANDYLARAQREADRLIEEERIVLKARERADEIIQEAQAEAARLRADAEQEADGIHQQAEQEVDELYARLGENLERILGQLKR